MGGRNAVAGAGRKPKVKATGDTDFENVFDIDVPDYMLGMENAVVMWKATVPLLLERKFLKSTDLHNIEMFCIAYQNMREAQKDVAGRGVTIETAMGRSKNPALTALNEAARQMATFGALLGLDPSSRARLMGGGGKPKSNAFAEVIGM